MGAKQRVEPPDALKSARERDLNDRQLRLGEQLLGQEQALGLGQLDRRDAELLPDRAAELPRARVPDRRASCSRLPPSFKAPASIRPAAARAVRLTESTGAWPGASSGRHRRHGRNPSRSAKAALEKNRQRGRPGVRAGQIGRQ